MKELINSVHPEDKEEFIHGVEQLRIGEPMNTQYRIITPSGKTKYLHTIAHPLLSETGQILRFTGTTHDLTGLRDKEVEYENQKFLLKKAFELARIGTWELDLETQHLRWSRELKKIMGMKEDKSSPSTEVFFAMLNPDDRRILQTMIEEQIESGEPSSVEYNIYLHGEIKTILSMSQAIKDENGKVTKLSGIAMDVSNTRRTEQKLKATEDLFYSFFENAPDAVLIENEEGIILNANKNACEMKGLKRTDIIGKNLLDLIPLEHHTEVMRNFKQMFSGESDSIQTRTWNISGREVPIQIKATKILYKDQPAILLNIRNSE
jgi:PAS domain S-box-containing protein